ncbi:histidine kinase dimerization/phospho-acceptor domain-containing protein [Algoriphagus boritolerans]|uniref:histidine kinase dimerization/phospho-acceptor domain-containing protein n=1 Tax=Algoriphagus boritolerans TaxID=308111 RepID=UPI000A73386D
MQEQQLLDLSLQRRNELLVGIALVLIVLGFLVWFQKKNHEKLKDAHLQLEKAHALTQEQNRKIQTQADHLNEINQALTKANQFRDKIFSVISHDLRAPFSSLHSIIQLWDKKMLTEEELQEVMPMIAKDTHSLSLMLNNLLIWSREQMGVEEVQKSTFNLEDLVNESVELLNSQITHKKT